MVIRYKYIIYSIILASFLYSDKGYNTIYLMEFENVDNNFTIVNLTTALPDLIKGNYKFREDINVEYAGDIRPYLEPNIWTEDEPIKGMLVNGKYYVSGSELFVEFEAYDIHNWNQLVKRELYCPVDDVICLHDAFLITVEKYISPFLIEEVNVDMMVEQFKNIPQPRRPKSIQKNDEDFISNNKEDYPKSSTSNNDINLQGQYGNRYFREFHFQNDKTKPSLEKNTADLINVLDQILVNPYDIIIGNLSVEIDKFDSQIYNCDLPVDFSVKNVLVQDLLTNLPHQKITNKEGSVILQFSKSDFIFDKALIEKLALMKYQLMPVIFFTNKSGGIQFVILDSWNERYNKLKVKHIHVIRANKFSPLFAITPGSDNILINMDISSFGVNYNFSIPYDLLDDYTKVTVKFMHESELDKLLTGNIKES